MSAVPQTAGRTADDRVVLRFLREAANLPTLDALTDAFAEVTAAFGFDHFMCAYIATPGRPVRPQMLFGRPHLPSMQRYVSQKLAAYDPTVQYIFASTQAFTWAEMLARPLSRDQRRVFDNAAGEGFLDGLVVPVHGAAGDIWAVSMISRSVLSLERQTRAMLAAAATLYATTGAALADKSEDVAIATPLTRRETQCLGWVAHGKTDWEIAQLLGIGDKTVNMHVDSARRKLGAPTRGQAAVIAWRRGWLLDYPD